LIAKGINASNIVVLTPTVVLDTTYLQSFKIDCACQVDVSNSSSENWFESFLEYIDVTETELDAILTESEDDNFSFDQIDCVVQAIKAMRFNWPQCPIQMLQTYLQTKGLELDVLENNPTFLQRLSRNCIKNFSVHFRVIVHCFRM